MMLVVMNLGMTKMVAIVMMGSYGPPPPRCVSVVSNHMWDALSRSIIVRRRPCRWRYEGDGDTQMLLAMARVATTMMLMMAITHDTSLN